jgi:hypothetical protein
MQGHARARGIDFLERSYELAGCCHASARAEAMRRGRRDVEVMGRGQDAGSILGPHGASPCTGDGLHQAKSTDRSAREMEPGGARFSDGAACAGLERKGGPARNHGAHRRSDVRGEQRCGGRQGRRRKFPTQVVGLSRDVSGSYTKWLETLQICKVEGKFYQALYNFWWEDHLYKCCWSCILVMDC